MGHSLAAPDPVPPGRVLDEQTGCRITSEWRNGKLWQHLSEDGLAAIYPMRYQIGAGKVGHSYAVQVGEYLLESPASYFRRSGWDLSPGFRGAEYLDFNRVLTERCFFCHSSFPQSFTGRRMGSSKLAAITCDRCHGDTTAHVSRPSAANIINPAKLPPRARDSVCEQCHLEGVARVLNPGKAWHDFKPGDELETTLAIYVAKQPISDIKAVSQEEQLALSRCARESSGKLWCGTCHNPHRQAKNRTAEIRAICQSCHQTLTPANHPAANANCVQCHMPSRAPTDVAHAALTDHRIRARADETAELNPRAAGAQELRAWHEPPSEIQKRDLGLASLEASANPGSQRLAKLAGELLASLPAAEQTDDPQVAAALGDIRLTEGHSAEALPFLEAACKLVPASGEYAMYLGIAREKTGDLAGATQALQRAIELDPSLERAYLELASVDRGQGRTSEANRVLTGYLRWNPQAILMRLTQQGAADQEK
ncbi:MAG TPA: cytochrome c3 family protein [Bryobacteraceae bacterium]|nr:cytochrome c3 family protein [Bryobacteraceae bacterium]